MKAQNLEFKDAKRNNNDTEVRAQEAVLSKIIALNAWSERGDVEALFEAVKKHLTRTEGAKALNLGSSRGVAPMALAALGFKVTELNLYKNSFIQEISQLKQKFDLIHDNECLTLTPKAEDRAVMMTEILNALTINGKVVLKTEILCDTYNPEESFESVTLDQNYILWRRTPACDIPGLVEMNGSTWAAHKKVAPREMIIQELKNAGFKVLSEVIEKSTGNVPAVMRLVLTRQN